MDVSPADSKTIYGVFGLAQVSRDSGGTWTATGKPPAGLIAIAASSLDARRVYAATKAGLFMSEDQGKTWTLAQFGSEPVSLVKSGSDGQLYAFVLGRGLLKANEKDIASWTPLANGFGDGIPLHLAIDPADGNRLYLTTQDNAVLASADGGQTWKVFGAR